MSISELFLAFQVDLKCCIVSVRFLARMLKIDGSSQWSDDYAETVLVASSFRIMKKLIASPDKSHVLTLDDIIEVMSSMYCWGKSRESQNNAYVYPSVCLHVSV